MSVVCKWINTPLHPRISLFFQILSFVTALFLLFTSQYSVAQSVHSHQRNKNLAILPVNPVNIVRDSSPNNNYFFTFDCHNDRRNVDYMLRTLRKYGVHVTFFLTGRFIKDNPDLTRQITRLGHTVGNHTMTHSQYPDPASLIAELKATEKLYKQTTGQKMTKLWRAPYLQHLGKWWQLSAARSIGYQHIDVSLCLTDWVDRGSGQYLANEKFLEIFKNSIDFTHFRRMHFNGYNYRHYRNTDDGFKPDYEGIISLMHAGQFRGNERDFVYCLEPMIKHLQTLGYRFQTCDVFLQREAKIR